MHPKLKITVIGSTNVDLIIKSPRIPAVGETVIGGEFFSAGGGKGANQAVAAARAGGDVTFISSVGSDDFGAKSIEGFKEDGINTEFVKIFENSSTGIALIMVDSSGQNSISVASGANVDLLPSEFSDEMIERIISSQILLMQLETPIETIEYAANLAAQNKVSVILNPAPAQKLSDDLLKIIDIITPNEVEAEMLTEIKIVDIDSAKSASEVLLKKGVKTVIITMGSKGCYLRTNELDFYQQAFKVNAVDSTASGDVFNGALAASLSSNINIIDSVKYASAAAAISVTKIGAQDSAPNKDKIESFMKSYKTKLE